MSKTTTRVREGPEPDADASARPEPGARRGGRTGGLAAYYRLRSIALEQRVATLEGRLERKDHQLRSIIARYEEILQSRDAEATVVTSLE